MRRVPGALVLAALTLLAACKFSGDGVGDAATGEASSSSSSGGGGEATEGDGTSGPGPTTGGTTQGEASVAATAASADCGDGVVDAGEECDDAAGNGADRTCTPACTVNVCGDGYRLPATEACDDGNDEVTDGCVVCQAARCGDGYVYANVESCDGAGESVDCDADCSSASCGDGVRNAAAGEVCDLGADNGKYASGCAAGCDGPGPSCGDGVVDAPDEMCDPGAPLPNHLGCQQECKVIGCQTDWGDCDGEPDNGCEIDLRSSKNHCGECGHVCVIKCENADCTI